MGDNNLSPATSTRQPQITSENTLLQWAVVNSINTATAREDTTRPTAPADMQPIDPKWVDIILGKKDAVRLKECVEIIVDETQALEDRLTYFDEFESLVETLDNANDLRPLGLWTPILTLLETAPQPEIRRYAAWAIGTSIQNNAKSQNDLLDIGGLEKLLKALKDDSDTQVKMKCLRCVSGLIRNNPVGFKSFYSLNGFKLVAQLLSLPHRQASTTNTAVAADSSLSPNQPVQELDLYCRCLFMLNAMLQTYVVDENNDNTAALSSEERQIRQIGSLTAIACAKEEVIHAIVSLLGLPESNVDLVEKCATFLLLVNGIDTSLLNLDLKAAIQKSMPSLKRFNEDEEVKRAVVALEALALPVSSSSR